MSTPLSTRYQRPLTFGAILDESIQLFRRRWLTLAAIQLVMVVPYLIILAVLGGLGFLALTSNSAALTQLANNPVALASIIASAIGAGFVIGLVFGVCELIAHGAGIVTSDAAMRNQDRSAGLALSTALPRVWALLGAALLIVVGAIGLSIVSVPLLALSVVFPLTIIALIVWAVSPSVRRPWLKWFIILTTPFGLPIYYGTRWSLYALPAVLERLGPLSSIRRSSELISGSWFRTWGVLHQL
jgi:hypothetical protein